MSLVAPIILATSLNAQPVPEMRSPADESKAAITAVVKATFITSGMDKHVKLIEKRYVSKPVRKYGGWIITIIKIQQEKRISYEWTF